MDYEQDYSKLTQTDHQWYLSGGSCDSPSAGGMGISRDTTDADTCVNSQAEVAGMLDNEDFD